jgi:hypothetical protein
MERRVVTLVIAVALGVASTGCGASGDDEYENRLRPPQPIVVTAAINEDGVSVSPRTFGAGPVEVIVTNLSDQARELTLETDEIGRTGGGIAQSTGSINPGDTARLQAQLDRGRYEISVDGRQGTPLRVGASRPSAQNELLTP